MQPNSFDPKTTGSKPSKPVSKARTRVKQSDAAKIAGTETLHLTSKSAINPTADEIEISQPPMPGSEPPQELQVISMIAEAAYYLAESRSFTPGHEMEDWLRAEEQIRTRNS